MGESGDRFFKKYIDAATRQSYLKTYWANAREYCDLQYQLAPARQEETEQLRRLCLGVSRIMETTSTFEDILGNAIASIDASAKAVAKAKAEQNTSLKLTLLSNVLLASAVNFATWRK